MLVPEPEPAAPAAEAIALDVVYEDRHPHRHRQAGAPRRASRPPGTPPARSSTRSSPIAATACPASAASSGRASCIASTRAPRGCWWSPRRTPRTRGLSEQFAAHGADGRMQRAYLALVWGKPLRPRGTISARLARSAAEPHQDRRGQGRERAPRGHALRGARDASRRTAPRLAPAARLETGRTHQIRVHLAHLGHPVLGDRDLRQRLQGQRRHAARSSAPGARVSSTGRRCTPPSSASSTRSRARSYTSRARSRATWTALVDALWRPH